MRFLVSLIAGLVLLGAAPIGAAEAAPVAHFAPAATGTAKPPKATFGAGPASDGKIDGRPYFTYDASPGGYLEDHLAIINFAGVKQALSVYTVDAVSATNGDFSYLPRSAPRTGPGAWLSVSTPGGPGQVTVGPHATVILPFRLRVPTSASPGDHAGAVIVSLTGLVKNSKGEQVKFEQRIATRVIIRVSGPLRPQLSIENLHATYGGHLNPFAQGTVTVTYTVRNTGNALLGAGQRVDLRGLFGSAWRAPALPGIPLLLPGASYKVSVRVHRISPEITINVTARLTPQGLRGDINPGIHVTTASVQVWAVPWLLIALLVVLVLVIGALIWRRRRRSRPPVRSDVTPTPQGATP
jgi:hypothetical protein